MAIKFLNSLDGTGSIDTLGDKLYLTNVASSGQDGILAYDSTNTAAGSRIFSFTRGAGNSLKYHSYGYHIWYSGAASGTGDSTFRMILNSSGNLGIGTTNPTAKLHVAGGRLEVDSNSNLPIIRARYNSNYYTDYDSNGINFVGAGQNFDVRDNGTTVLYLKSGGNVGIGTTSPSTRLDVAGDITLTNASNPTFTFNSNDSAIINRTGTGSGFYIQKAGSTQLMVNSSGNVGINITSPSQTLDVNGTAYFRGMVGVNGEGKGITVDSGYGVSGRVGLMKYAGLEGMLVAGNTTKLRLGRRTDASTVAAAGTPTISVDLQINTDGKVQLPQYGSNTFTGTATYALAVDSSGNIIETTVQSSPAGIDGTGTVNYLTKWSTTDTLTSSVMYDNGTNIGIGTTSPSYKLQVNGTARFGDGSPYLKVTSSSVEVEGSYLFAAYQGGVSFYAYDSVFRGLIKSDGSGSNALKLGDTVERMRIVGGNVGISTTSPSEKLHVAGNITADEYKYNGAERVESKNWKYIATVSGGYYEELGQWRATEGNIVLRITVASNTGGHSGTAVYILQGGFNQAADGWFELLPAFKGGGHGQAQDGWKVLWYDNASYTYKLAVAVPSGLSQKNLHVSVELLSNPDSDTYYQYSALSTTGVIPSYSLDRDTSYSHRDLISNDTVTAQYDATNYTVLGYDSLDTYGGSQVFKTAGTERMRIATNGDVGIGTTSPNEKLHVAGNIRVANSGKLYLWNDHDVNFIDYKEWQTSSSTGMTIENQAASGHVKIVSNSNVGLYVNNDGNVGIGTTSPATNLDISSSTGAVLRLGTSDTVVLDGDTIGRIEFFSSDATNTNSGLGAFIDLVADGDQNNFAPKGDLRFATSYASVQNATTRMTIKGTGNVGIGTTAPLGKLQINEYTVGANGNQGVHGELSVFANSGDESLFLGIKDASYPNRGWAFNPVTYGVNSNLQIKEHGSTAVRMTIQSGGNVGIGTTSPSEKLHVAGNVRATGWIGRDSSNYITFDETNNYIDFYAGGNWVARMESDGDLHVKGDVIAFSDIFNP